MTKVQVLAIPDGYKVEAMVAVGKPGAKGDLPAHLQEREVPSPRENLLKRYPLGLPSAWRWHWE